MVLYGSHAVHSLEIPHSYLHLLLPQIHLSKFRNFELVRKLEFGRLCSIFNFHNLFFILWLQDAEEYPDILAIFVQYSEENFLLR